MFRDGHVLIHPKGSSITSAVKIGVRSGKLYKLSFQLHHALAHDSNSDCGDLCELWHRRMAHLYHPSLRNLREIVTGVPEFNIEHSEVCKGCALGKYVKTTFPSSDSKAAGALDLI